MRGWNILHQMTVARSGFECKKENRLLRYYWGKGESLLTTRMKDEGGETSSTKWTLQDVDLNKKWKIDRYFTVRRTGSLYWAIIDGWRGRNSFHQMTVARSRFQFSWTCFSFDFVGFSRQRFSANFSILLENQLCNLNSCLLFKTSLATTLCFSSELLLELNWGVAELCFSSSFLSRF